MALLSSRDRLLQRALRRHARHTGELALVLEELRLPQVRVGGDGIRPLGDGTLQMGDRRPIAAVVQRHLAVRKGDGRRRGRAPAPAQPMEDGPADADEREGRRHAGEQRATLAPLGRQRIPEEEDGHHQHRQRGGEMSEPPLCRVGLLVRGLTQPEQPVALPLRGLLVARRERLVAVAAELRARAAAAPLELGGADHGQRSGGAPGGLRGAPNGNLRGLRDGPRVARGSLSRGSTGRTPAGQCRACCCSSPTVR